MRLDLEGDRVALADVHHARVLADAGQQRGAGRRLLGELAQVPPGGLVGAVLAPHDRVDGQLASVGRRPSSCRSAGTRRRSGPARRRAAAGRRRAAARAGSSRCPAPLMLTGPPAGAATEVKNPSPSRPGPVSGSIACSGCGISPTTFPASFLIPAMSRAEPFGLPPRTWPRPAPAPPAGPDPPRRRRRRPRRSSGPA